MAVVDFRSGGFEGKQPPQLSQEFPYDPDSQGQQGDAWHEEQWDDARFATEAMPGTLDQSNTLLGRVSRLTHYLGALVSVGLIVILAVWGFKLVVRDVSGVPVIRAIQGEARTAPENPGGELTNHTGLSVNAVAGGNDVSAADRVALAPSTTGLGEADVAMGEFGATAQNPTNASDLPLMTETTRVIPLPDGAVPEAPAVTDTAAPASEAPVNEAVTDLDGQTTQDAAITSALAEAVAPPPAVANSARPAPRPRRVAAASVVAAAEPATAQAATEAPATRPEATPAAAEPATASAGGDRAQVQIGAFDSDALARGEWGRVSGKYGALFSGKSMIVQEAKSNGRMFWRLRVGGFENRDEARRFCAALISGGTDCIPAPASK